MPGETQGAGHGYSGAQAGERARSHAGDDRVQGGPSAAGSREKENGCPAPATSAWLRVSSVAKLASASAPSSTVIDAALAIGRGIDGEDAHRPACSTVGPARRGRVAPAPGARARRLRSRGSSASSGGLPSQRRSRGEPVGFSGSEPAPEPDRRPASPSGLRLPVALSSSISSRLPRGASPGRGPTPPRSPPCPVFSRSMSSTRPPIPAGTRPRATRSGRHAGRRAGWDGCGTSTKVGEMMPARTPRPSPRPWVKVVCPLPARR